jgi:hypothetical protein
MATAPWSGARALGLRGMGYDSFYSSVRTICTETTTNESWRISNLWRSFRLTILGTMIQSNAGRFGGYVSCGIVGCLGTVRVRQMVEHPSSFSTGSGNLLSPSSLSDAISRTLLSTQNLLKSNILPTISIQSISINLRAIIPSFVILACSRALVMAIMGRSMRGNGREIRRNAFVRLFFENRRKELRNERRRGGNAGGSGMGKRS